MSIEVHSPRTGAARSFVWTPDSVHGAGFAQGCPRSMQAHTLRQRGPLPRAS